MSRTALGTVRYSDEQIARIVAELERSGVRRALRQLDDEAVAVQRAREACPCCEQGDQSAAAIQHHNLRASEYGERSYPCTRRAAA